MKRRRRVSSPKKVREAVTGRGWYESIPVPPKAPHPPLAKGEIAPPAPPCEAGGGEEGPF